MFRFTRGWVHAMMGVSILFAVLVAVLIFAVIAIMSQIAQPEASAQDDGQMYYGVSAYALRDIPRNYLLLYQQAGKKYHLDWSVLAAIGKVETDHGRSPGTGVTSGENYAGAGGPMQFLQPTWEMYGDDGNGDGRRDRYNPADAIFGAANYLKSSGAPANYQKAIFAYNHAMWYVQKVLGFAKRYRGNLLKAATTSMSFRGFSGKTQRVQGGKRRIVPLPGFPGESCDIRIVRDVLFLAAKFDLQITDCYAESGHAADGEHPRGLAIDAVPKQGGGCGSTWRKVNVLAAWAEPKQNQPRPPFRWVGYNGDANHGCGNHLHLSWNHGPAGVGGIGAWVEVFSFQN